VGGSSGPVARLKIHGRFRVGSISREPDRLTDDRGPLSVESGLLGPGDDAQAAEQHDAQDRHDNGSLPPRYTGQTRLEGGHADALGRDVCEDKVLVIKSIGRDLVRQLQVQR
jgi:hypothetical protein